MGRGRMKEQRAVMVQNVDEATDRIRTSTGGGPRPTKVQGAEQHMVKDKGIATGKRGKSLRVITQANIMAVRADPDQGGRAPIRKDRWEKGVVDAIRVRAKE